MKSIEERAKEYSLKDFDGYYTGRENAMEEGYIAGATEQKAIDEVADLKEMPCLAELGDWHKCANYVLDEIGDISTMTKNEIVYAVVGKVFEYSKNEV